MKSFDSAIVTALASEEAAIAFLLKLEFTTELRYTDIDISVFDNSEEYRPMPFRMSNYTISDGGIETVTIDLDAVGQEITTAILAEDIRGKWAEFGFTVIDNSTYQPVADRELLFKGFVNDFELDPNGVCSLELAHESIFWAKKPLRIFQADCPWAFGGLDECRYGLLSKSETVDWNYQYSSRSTGAATDPEGANDAIKIIEDTSNTYHRAVKGSFPITPGDYHWFGVYAKAGERTRIRLKIYETSPYEDQFWVDFDLNDGSTLNATDNNEADLADYGIESYQNGWYKCWIKGRVNGDANTVNILINLLDASGSVIYTGDGSSGLYLWQALLHKIVTTWCDQTHDRCTALANTAHFGGYRFLPAIKEKKFMWGSK